jgi:uncharacterized membrane protein
MSGRISEVHNDFPTSLLERCLKALEEVIIDGVVTLETGLSYPEYLIKLIDRQDHVMRRRTIIFYEVLCSQHMETKFDALPSQSKGVALCFLILPFLL